jgi:hypothetical protein
LFCRSSQKSKILFVQDYIPEDSRLEDAPYTISIYFFNKNIDAKEATYQKTSELDPDKKQTNIAHTMSPKILTEPSLL